ncbi:MAG: hypothetical protein HY700_01920 [Gemmatimonadetes bacterium]|nr:hypothetical protein [Gemmatimonadota bacterium]
MRSALLLATLAGLVGCSSSVDPLKSGVQVSFATRNPALSGPTGPAPTAPILSPRAAAGDTLRDATNTLIIDKAELVLRKIELEPTGTSTCTPNPEGCPDVEAGPVLVNLPLTPGAQTTFSVQVPAGTYGKVKFEIHKVSSDDPAEAAFRAANPDFVGKSIRVQGKYNGQAFIYVSEMDVEQELTMSPGLVVSADAASANLTIRLTISQWFRTLAGGLLDPGTANKGGQNESLVNNNIQNSMKAFEDKDHDGDERDG